MTDINIDFETYDSDIEKMQPVFRAIHQMAFTIMSFDSFREQVINRFGEAGFTCTVVWDETYAIGATECRDPIISVTGRIESEEFDYDRQVHEVTHDVLGLGEGGVITQGGIIREPPKPVGF